ncbi:MAG: ABC transporter ATP-binding protein [Bradymonadaceae bacterium]
MKDAPVKKDGATQGRSIAKLGGADVVIAARRLSYWYGQVIGINDISIDIGQGVIGLLGPNGAGKSTLFKVLTGQLRPRTGTVNIFGRKVWNNPQVFSEIGFVPEQDAFYEEMTGRDFVIYLTRLQGFSKEDAAKLAEEAIETVSLADQAHRRIQEYSKGMRQRIKIAQALAHKPRVLFLDEPLSGTDPVGRRHIIDLIKKLGDAGTCVLVSSHILHEVEQMTTDILLINKGRILADGNVFRIREMIDEHPHTIFVGCDRPRELAGALTTYEDVLRVEFVEGGFKIATGNPDACYARIPQIALDNGIRLQRMTSPDNNLTAVFQYLVR